MRTLNKVMAARYQHENLVTRYVAYAVSLSGLLTTCRHHFVQRPHAQCNSIVSFLQRGRVTSRLRGNAMKQWAYSTGKVPSNNFRLRPLPHSQNVTIGVVHNCHHFHERTQRTLGGGGGGQGRPYAFLNVVYSDGNEIIAHVRRTSMTKNPLVRYSLLVQKLVT